MRCRRADGPRHAARSSGGVLQACRRGGVEDIKISSSGGMLRAWRHGGTEIWSLGGVLRARGRGGTGRYGDLELGRRAAGAGTWRCLPQELLSCGGVL